MTAHHLDVLPVRRVWACLGRSLLRAAAARELPSDPDGWIRYLGPVAFCEQTGTRLCSGDDVGPAVERRAKVQRHRVAGRLPSMEAQAATFASWCDRQGRDEDTHALRRLARRWPLAGGGQGPLDHEQHIAAPAREAERLRMAESLRIIDEQRAALPRGGADVMTRASSYLATCDGSDAHAALQSVCYRITRGFSLPADVALDLLMREWVPRCSPRWKLHDVRRSVRGAARKGGESGWLLVGRSA